MNTPVTQSADTPSAKLAFQLYAAIGIAVFLLMILANCKLVLIGAFCLFSTIALAILPGNLSSPKSFIISKSFSSG